MHLMLAGRMHWTRVFTDAITEISNVQGDLTDVLANTQSLVAVLIFMNSSVRGLFMHLMLARRMHWMRVFTDAITETSNVQGDLTDIP